MRLTNTLLSLFVLWGSNALFGQNTTVDPQARAAIQVGLSIAFGAGTVAGRDCPGGTSTGECFAIIPLVDLPPGHRMVIQNISATLTFNANGGTDVAQQCLTLFVLVGSNASISCLPFSQIQQLSQGYSANLNQHVHIYADVPVDSPPPGGQDP